MYYNIWSFKPKYYKEMKNFRTFLFISFYLTFEIHSMKTMVANCYLLCSQFTISTPWFTDVANASEPIKEHNWSLRHGQNLGTPESKYCRGIFREPRYVAMEFIDACRVYKSEIGMVSKSDSWDLHMESTQWQGLRNPIFSTPPFWKKTQTFRTSGKSLKTSICVINIHFVH